MSSRAVPVASMALLTLVAAGCAADAPRDPAEKRNVAALETIPPPPSARLVRTETSGDHAPDTSEGPIVGWTTSREFALGRPVRSRALIARVDRSLQEAGWRLGSGGGFYRNARRGSSCVHVLAGPEPPTSDDAPIPTQMATADAPPVEKDPADEIARSISFIVTSC